MSLLVVIVVGLILIGLLVYGVGYLSPPLDAGIVRIIQAAVIILGALLIAQRCGII